MGEMADWQIDQMLMPDEDGWVDEYEREEANREHRLEQQRKRRREKREQAKRGD